MRTPFRLLVPLLVVACSALPLTACGSDDGTTDVGTGTDEVAGAESPIPVEPDGGIGDGAEPLPGAQSPIPVEPDGGIGDGAEPLPGAEPSVDAGDWHGAELAVTNCPGVDFQRVEATAFSFSVPVDFVDQQSSGVDSEIGQWTNGSIDVFYDYGWYSGPVAGLPGAQVTAIDYSGFTGELAVVEPSASPDGRGLVGVFFAEIEPGDQPNRLTLTVQFDDPADEIIGRCIVGSIEWKVPLPS